MSGRLVHPFRLFDQVPAEDEAKFTKLVETLVAEVQTTFSTVVCGVLNSSGLSVLYSMCITCTASHVWYVM